MPLEIIFNMNNYLSSRFLFFAYLLLILDQTGNSDPVTGKKYHVSQVFSIQLLKSK